MFEELPKEIRIAALSIALMFCFIICIIAWAYAGIFFCELVIGGGTEPGSFGRIVAVACGLLVGGIATGFTTDIVKRRARRWK